MTNVRWLTSCVAAVLCFNAPAMAQFPASSTATVHNACGDVSPFEAGYDIGPANYPPQPQQSTLDGTARYKNSWEIFRSGSIEPYNSALQAFTADLGRISRTAVRRAAAGTCTMDEFAEIHDALSRQYEMAGDEYIAPYFAAIATLRSENIWAATETQRLIVCARFGCSP